MTNERNFGFIELIGYTRPTEEQQNEPDDKPKLTINAKALEIISEQFQSPISILVFTGNMGAGKSKLASLTAATLMQKNGDQTLLPFQSSSDFIKVTRGVQMWRFPLKHLNNGKKGSILLLDCEGVNSYNQKISADLYLFCMIISTVFGFAFQLARIDYQVGDRLYQTLSRFEKMKTPSILPRLWLVPLELPHLKHGGKQISEYQWVETVFSEKIAGEELPLQDKRNLARQFQYIRGKLQKIDVANITYLPNYFKDDDRTMSDMYSALREQANSEYYTYLKAAVERFTQSAGKRLPGSSSPTLFFRPVELTQFMSDLIDVINQDKEPNPDELIGRYLLKRFIDEVAIQKRVEFRRDLLQYAENYATNNLKKEEEATERQNTNDKLRLKRMSLIDEYINLLEKQAEEKIYGSNSILLKSTLFNEKLQDIRKQMEVYDDPEILFEEVRRKHTSGNQNAQTANLDALSPEMRKKIDRIIDRIDREKRIDDSINPEHKRELAVDVEKCENCGRSNDFINITHKKTVCTEGGGNYYRYNDERDRMVCNACRKIENIKPTKIRCRNCGRDRFISPSSYS